MKRHLITGSSRRVQPAFPSPDSLSPFALSALSLLSLSLSLLLAPPSLPSIAHRLLLLFFLFFFSSLLQSLPVLFLLFSSVTTSSAVSPASSSACPDSPFLGSRLGSQCRVHLHRTYFRPSTAYDTTPFRRAASRQGQAAGDVVPSQFSHPQPAALSLARRCARPPSA